MKAIKQTSPTSVILRVKLMNSSVFTGAGLTGLSEVSAGLIISTIKYGEAAPTVYSQAAGTIETIGTLGTYVAPTATKCRFKEVDAVNHKGMFEIQIADARFANAKSLIVSISGAANLAEADFEIQMEPVEIYNISDLKNSIWNATMQYVDKTGAIKGTKAWIMLQALFSTIEQRLKEME